MSRPPVEPMCETPESRAQPPVLPPSARSRAALGLTSAAARGRFELQVCSACGAVQYPPRQSCRRCLDGELIWSEQSGAGELISETTVRVSQDPYYRERGPWRIGIVSLDAGPSVIAHVHSGCASAPSRVRVGVRLDQSGQGVLVAFPVNEVPNVANDRQLREMTYGPKSRKVLVTDGRGSVGRAIVDAVVTAGAEFVWVGAPEPAKLSDGLEQIRKHPQVALIPLDVADSRSVREAAAEIGGEVDILINTAQVQMQGPDSRTGVEVARAEMEVSYFGTLLLAQEFGALMRCRRAEGQASAIAWVNLLSIYALSSLPTRGAFSAAKAAAFSLTQCLRAEMGASGIRVINLFPGLIDDESNRSLPAPKLSPEALAKAVVKALVDGVEDVYPGDVAQEWFARWRDDPKVLEREVSAGAFHPR